MDLIDLETFSNFSHRKHSCRVNRGGSRTAATSKVERLVIIVNGWKALTIITRRSILDVAGALDPPLVNTHSVIE